MTLVDAATKLPDIINLVQYDLTNGDYTILSNPDFLVRSETLEHITEVTTAVEQPADIAG